MKKLNDYHYDSGDGVIHIKVTNLNEFKKIINKAEEQAEQLEKTINELKWFALDFHFTIQEPEVDE